MLCPRCSPWAISGRREDFPQPAVRCGTDGLRAGVVNPPGLTCAALPLTSEGRQRIKR
ncbi:transcriptional regulator [Pseudomonas aeruginosa]|nr:transcriptional regulator [Pseudomonas aeruginosa]